MDKKEIFEILMQSESDFINDLAERLKKTIPFEVVKKPESGLVMYRMIESVENIPFNVGEVLVTKAEVKVYESLGYAVIMGMDNIRALNCAFLMGIIEAELIKSDEVIKLSKLLKAEKFNALNEEKEIISSTRVKFETMGGQDPNASHNKK